MEVIVPCAEPCCDMCGEHIEGYVVCAFCGAVMCPSCAIEYEFSDLIVCPDCGIDSNNGISQTY